MIETLRQEIPTFTCLPGCRECCGPVPVSPAEEARLRRCGLTEFAGAAVKDLKTLSPVLCVLATDAGCAMYDERPIMCRLFGAVEDLPCPHGMGPETPLTRQEAQTLLRKYITTFSSERRV